MGGMISGTDGFVNLAKDVQFVETRESDADDIESQAHHSWDLVEFPAVQLESDQQSDECAHESGHGIDHGRTVD